MITAGLLLVACRTTLETAPLRMDVPATQMPLEVIRVSEFGVLPVVTARVGHEDRQFLVDTGTNVIGVSERVARDLPAGSCASVVARIEGSDDERRVVRLPEVVIGGAILPNQDAVVVDLLDRINKELGTNINGILGEPFFRNFAITLDFDRVQLHISALPLSERAVPIEIRGGSPVLEIDLVGTGKEYFLLDTGCPSSIHVTSASRLGRALGDRSHLPGFLDNNDVAHSVGVAPMVEVARLAFSDATVIISDTRSPDPARVGHVGGQIGSGLLLGCSLSIDYRSRLMVLTRSGHASTDRGGWGLAFRGREDGVVVTQVLMGSPADAAGLRKGDRILQVGGLGTPVSVVALCSWLDAHNSVTIQVEREGATLGFRLNRSVYLPRLPGR